MAAELSLRLGDCLEAMTSIPDGSVDMVFADLPYGVTRNRWDTVISFESLWRELLRVGKTNAAFVFTATQPFATSLINSQPNLFRYDLVWRKRSVSGFLNAQRMPLRNFESVLLFYKKTPSYTPQKTTGHSAYRRGASNVAGPTYRPGLTFAAHVNDGTRYPTALIGPFEESELKGFRAKRLLHPTQKPVALLEWLIKTYSNPGDTVLDPTMGSGTTGVACVNTGRHFIGIEKDPGYFLTAQKRIAEARLT